MLHHNISARPRYAPALKICVSLLTVLSLLALASTKAAAQGTLTNGWTHTGTISPAGDSDIWTFSASIGDRIVLRIGEITQTGSFTPRIRLQNPSAVQIATASGTVATEISLIATNTGTFTVIADDAAGTVATGTYRLTLAKSPGEIFVAPGDEGGPLTNGVMNTGTIDVGDLDVWAFTATSGESITARMGEMVGGSSLTPQLRLYGPNGALLDSLDGNAATEVAIRATNSGTFTLVVGDLSSGWSGSGSYRLTLAKTGVPIVVSAGDEGGPLTNGVMNTGTIDVGDIDVWDFTATSGESITVRMGEVVGGSALTPAIWLYGPNGALLDSYGAGGVAAEVAVRATNSGTFTVVAGDFSSGWSGSGTYRLTLAKTGVPIVISAGDEGGPLTNNVMHTGTIDFGDIDVWNFTATNGESITLRMGEIVSGSPLTPAIWLYGPNGAFLGSYGAGGVAADVSVRATNSGTFMVVAGDFSSFYTGNGTYRLTLAKTGDPIVVLPGDEGGPLSNGLMHTGTLEFGDLDVWNFTATNGDSITARIGETVNGSTLTPALWLYGPSGALLASYGAGGTAGEVNFRATNSGTFTIIAGDFSSFYTGAGSYRLTLMKTGSPFVIAPGDEGGPLTNGLMHTGVLDSGDLDIWTLNATNGDYIVVRIGETVASSSLSPALWLYGPNGALLDAFGEGGVASEVTFRATNSGVFTVVAGDFSSFYSGSGSYRLTLAKTRTPIAVSAGDEGGSLNGAPFYDGTLNAGDLDLFHFTACGGDFLVLQLNELVGGSALTPSLRIFGRDGALLRSAAGAGSALINFQATNSGTFLVVASDFSANYAGSGTYRLTATGLTDGLKLCIPIIFGTNTNLRGIGGTSNATFRLYTATNVTTPAVLWTPILTNQFDVFGTFAHTNLFSPAEPQRYFRLLQL